MSSFYHEQAEREYDEELAKLQRDLDRRYPGEGWDAELYRAMQESLEKDD